jgi:hypothetical protein
VSATTVRTILTVILENNLQMDDVISFNLSQETMEVLGTYYDINHVATDLHTIKGRKEKTLNLIFDLQDITDDEVE